MTYKMLFYTIYLQCASLLTYKDNLLHMTLPTYKTLHNITELLTICYITYVHHLKYLMLLHLPYITLHYSLTIRYIAYLQMYVIYLHWVTERVI